MSDENLSFGERRSGARRVALIAVAGGLLAYGIYMAVMAGVRAHVDGLIEDNHGKALPAFALKDTEGKAFDTESLRGKAVVLHFMRSLCPACDQEKDEVRVFAGEVDSAKAVVLSVMLDEVMGFDPAVTRRTLERARFTHPILIADEAFVNAFHGAGWAKVTPITYFADKEGRIVTSLRGAQTRDALRTALDQALGRG